MYDNDDDDDDDIICINRYKIFHVERPKGETPSATPHIDVFSYIIIAHVHTLDTIIGDEMRARIRNRYREPDKNDITVAAIMIPASQIESVAARSSARSDCDSGQI